MRAHTLAHRTRVRASGHLNPLALWASGKIPLMSTPVGLISNQAGAGGRVIKKGRPSYTLGDASPITIIVARNVAMHFTHNDHKRRRGASDLGGFVGERQKWSPTAKSSQMSGSVCKA